MARRIAASSCKPTPGSHLSLAEIAASRGVGLETVRGQVKSLLRKMELRSQKQLVRILTRIAVALA